MAMGRTIEGEQAFRCRLHWKQFSVPFISQKGRLGVDEVFECRRRTRIIVRNVRQKHLVFVPLHPERRFKGLSVLFVLEL